MAFRLRAHAHQATALRQRSSAGLRERTVWQTVPTSVSPADIRDREAVLILCHSRLVWYPCSMRFFIRVMLSAEMERLRGPLLVSLLLALFVVVWRRPLYKGVLPVGARSWGTMLLRLITAIAISYSMAALICQNSLVSLISFTFAVLTLMLTSVVKEDRDFLRPLGWIALSLSIIKGFWPVVTE